jgi:hypothetical protein
MAAHAPDVSWAGDGLGSIDLDRCVSRVIVATAFRHRQFSDQEVDFWLLEAGDAYIQIDI